MYTFVILALTLAISSVASAAERVRFATDWRAQAAHGGFYQALVDGTYARYGLEVTLIQGGPQVNTAALLPAGRVDFLMTGNLLHNFDAVKNGLPEVAVAAMFQKDPQALFAHPGSGYEDFARMKDAPVAWIAKAGQFSWWQWLKAAHGFRDDALRPYNYTLGPFLSRKDSIQQGYAIAESVYIKEQGGFEPVMHLLADHGFSTYSTLITAHTKLVKEHPERVQRFVDASIEGWVNYLYGDRRAADARMREDNPEMTQGEIDSAVALIKKMGIVDSGDSLTRGIGSMTEARVADFFKRMADAGLYKADDVDLHKVATYQFVNRGTGLKLKSTLSAD